MTAQLVAEGQAGGEPCFLNLENIHVQLWLCATRNELSLSVFCFQVSNSGTGHFPSKSPKVYLSWWEGIFVLILGVELRSSCMLGQHFTTEPQP